MKLLRKNQNSANTINNLKHSLAQGQELSKNSLNLLRGGEGEDDGTVSIIIIPKEHPTKPQDKK
ncbi:MAG: hypothetical protein H6536_08235 [Bacteroidales bacterium]|nr:hypothetical protein [Bacteroidales bacterium]